MSAILKNDKLYGAIPTDAQYVKYNDSNVKAELDNRGTFLKSIKFSASKTSVSIKDEDLSKVKYLYILMDININNNHYFLQPTMMPFNSFTMNREHVISFYDGSAVRLFNFKIYNSGDDTLVYCQDLRKASSDTAIDGYVTFVQ